MTSSGVVSSQLRTFAQTVQRPRVLEFHDGRSQSGCGGLSRTDVQSCFADYFEVGNASVYLDVWTSKIVKN